MKKVNSKKSKDIEFQNIIDNVNTRIKRSDKTLAFYNLIKHHVTN